MPGSITARLCTPIPSPLLLLLPSTPNPRPTLLPRHSPSLPPTPPSRPRMLLPLLLRVILHPQLHIAVGIEPKA